LTESVSTRVVTTSEPTIRVRLPAASAWSAAVWAAAAVYALLLSVESIRDHNQFETAFDTAIYDQLLWLLAHGHDPFSTIVGRTMLADHFQPGLVLLTPLYWLGLGVPGMLAAQAIGLALTAPALYVLARAAGATPALASLPAFLWLVCPWVASANLFEFRPSSFAPALLVVSALAALQGRSVLLVLATVLALSLKEDVALMYVMLGLLVVYHGRRRMGVILAFGSAAWFVASSLVIESLGGSLDQFGRRFAGGRGDSVADALAWALAHPLETLGDVVSQSLLGLAALFLSTGGLALLAPSWMLLAAPTAFHNALSWYLPQHDLLHHYHLLTLTGFFVAAAIGIRRLSSLRRPGRLAVTGLVVALVVFSVVAGVRIRGAPSFDSYIDPSETQRALERIPAGAAVASVPRVLPHLSRRSEVYLFPEPFVRLEWGSLLNAEEMARRADRVRFVVYAEIDLRRSFEGSARDVRQMLLREGFVVVASAGPLQILERR